MSVLGLIAFISGTLGVWLTIKQSIWCWPMAILSTVCSGLDFYLSRLFGDMSLQVFYFFAGLYGWILWEKKRKDDFKALPMPLKYWPAIIGAGVLLFALCYYMLLYFEGARPLLDAALTAASLVTTYMMTRKWSQNWLLWVGIDGTYIILYGLTNLWFYAALYLLFTIMAWYGWRQWKKAA